MINFIFSGIFWQGLIGEAIVVVVVVVILLVVYVNFVVFFVDAAVVVVVAAVCSVVIVVVGIGPSERKLVFLFDAYSSSVEPS